MKLLLVLLAKLLLEVLFVLLLLSLLDIGGLQRRKLFLPWLWFLLLFFSLLLLTLVLLTLRSNSLLHSLLHFSHQILLKL